MNKVLGIILGIFLINSCGVSKETNDEVEIEEVVIESIAFDLIGKGNLGGAGEEGIYESNVVVQTKTEWDNLVSKMDAVNLESKHFQIQNIDFNSSTVLACFDKVQGTGGHSIKVYDVVEGKNELLVYTKKSSPTEMATSVMTQPYYIIAINKTTKKIVFK